MVEMKEKILNGEDLNSQFGWTLCICIDNIKDLLVRTWKRERQLDITRYKIFLRISCLFL